MAVPRTRRFPVLALLGLLCAFAPAAAPQTHAAGPVVELLEYLAPRDGRRFPADEHANDLVHWQTELLTADADAAAHALPAARVAAVSPGVVTLPDATLGFRRGDTFRDPDGHVMQLVER